MLIGKRTAKLLREAMVLGFAEGAQWGGYTPERRHEYPTDSEVVLSVLRTARSFSDLYPRLARVEGWHRLGGDRQVVKDGTASDDPEEVSG